jgi:hypothetical protein
MSGETLAEARDWLRERVDDGETCPCCGQFAKVYRRRIHATMARDLITFHKLSPDGEWVHVPTALVLRGGDFAKLAFWGLIEERGGERGDGSDRVGWWRTTRLGRSFVRGAVPVPKYARIYNGRCLGLAGEALYIREALGKRFDYAELMGLAVAS